MNRIEEHIDYGYGEQDYGYGDTNDGESGFIYGQNREGASSRSRREHISLSSLPDDYDDDDDDDCLIGSSVRRNLTSMRHELGKEGEELSEFVKSQRIKEWAKMFRRSDPRYQILNFFNDVAQEGASNMEDENFNPTMASPLLRAFYRSSVFTVWRPTSYDAIRRMMLGEGVGKGLDIKGKSAKKGYLSGFVPFLQIHEEAHKKDIRTLPRDGRIRVFYSSQRDLLRVVAYLRDVADEMVQTVIKARSIVEDEEIVDDDKNEWALSKLIWDMTDSSIRTIADYAPTKYGMEVPERLFWEALVVRQNIEQQPGSKFETGRPSEANFQNMNFAALRPGKDEDISKSRPVLMHYNDPHEERSNPFDPRSLLMAYEEHGRVMPVVSDFDCFIVGTRGVKYKSEVPDDQLAVTKWCIDQIETILDENTKTSSSWTSCWLDVLKNAATSGNYPEVPPLGYSDPQSHRIMKHAIHRLRKEGAVRHGAECFNYYFPQELDDEFLVISDQLSGQTLPWKYVDQRGLQEVLKEKIEEGYTFPINPKWVLCDPGWKDVFDRLVVSKAPNVQDSLCVWYPPESGIREKIESIHERHPGGFQRTIKEGGKRPEHDYEENKEGTAAMDLAELELKYFLTLQRAKRKLRGLIIWKSLLNERRKLVKRKK